MCVETVVGPFHHFSVEGWADNNTTTIVMCVLLFVLHVSMVRECEDDGNSGVGVVSAGHEYECVGGTRGSCIVLGMSVVRGMRGVGGVGMCLARAV